MATLSEALTLAIAHHQAGRLELAEQVYRQILAVVPDHVQTLYLSGELALQAGWFETAVERLRRARDLNPSEAAFHHSLGNALRAWGRLDEALACYRRAVELQPHFAEAHNNLGVLLEEQSLRDEALACYRRAMELKPDYAEAYNNLASALRDQQQLAEAVTHYQRAITLKPDYAEAHYNLGVACKDQGNLAAAEASYRRAIELRPAFAVAYNNLGIVLQEQRRGDEAVACFRSALELRPDYAEAYYNLGVACTEQGNLLEAAGCYRRALELQPGYAAADNNLGIVVQSQERFDEAIRCYRRAIEFQPDYAAAHYNLAVALDEQGNAEAALACYSRAIELRPDYVDAHWNRARAWLRAGNYRQGWPAYEWRWRTPGFTVRRFPQPAWNGDALAGKTILLYAEQGLGDTLMFIRYAPRVKQLGATVIVECQRPLVELLTGMAGIDQVLAQGDPLPPFDLYAPLLSVPGIVQATLETIPAQIPYLRPRPALVEQWRDRLRSLAGFKIGIVWQGSPQYRDDRRRSIPLRCFAPLAQLPGVQLVSLQQGLGCEQLAEIGELFPVVELGPEVDQQAGPFMDTAAVMQNLDLVIAPDTVTAHLAGALGVPVWLALTYNADWRWLRNRADSPWYPTLRVFRQRQRGDWPGVFEELAKALAERTGRP